MQPDLPFDIDCRFDCMYHTPDDGSKPYWHVFPYKNDFKFTQTGPRRLVIHADGCGDGWFIVREVE